MRRLVIGLTIGLLGLATCGDDRYVLEQDRAAGEVPLPPITASLVAEFEINGPAVASGVSDRLSPPPTIEVSTTTTVPVIVPGRVGSALTGRCTQYEAWILIHSPPGGWDVARISFYADRESHCEPWQRSTTADSGLLQVNDINLAYLRVQLGEWVDRYTLLDPEQNIRAAAALCTFWRNAGVSCYHPWS